MAYYFCRSVGDTTDFKRDRKSVVHSRYTNSLVGIINVKKEFSRVAIKKTNLEYSWRQARVSLIAV